MEKILFLLGLLPLIIFCLVLILWKKKYLFTIPAIVVTVGLGVGGYKLLPESANDNMVNEEWMNYLAEVHMSSGDYDSAVEYLERMHQAYGDSPEGMVSWFRLSVMKEDMVQAGILAKEMLASPYAKELELTKEEKSFVDKIAAGEYVSANRYRLNRAIYESMKTNVDSPEEYGYNPVTEEELEEAQEYETELAEAVEDAIEDRIDAFEEKGRTEQFAEALETAKDLKAAMNGDIQIVEGDTEEGDTEENINKKIEKYFDELTEFYEEDEDILNLPEISDVYIDAAVLLEEYEALVEYADKSENKDALAAVAYLYMTDVIGDRHMDAFGAETDSDVVAEMCETIFDKMEEDDYSNAELAIYEDYYDAVSSRNDNVVLANIEERLANSLENGSADSGAYLQSAAINSALSDKNRVHENLNKALDNKDECEDPALSSILGKIDDIADKVSEDDEIRKFNDYLIEGYERSLPIDVAEVVVPEEFLNAGNTYINEKRTMINVGNINLDEFPEVQVYISTAGMDLEDIENLEISDCGVPIEDFKIEKVEYDSAQIILVCDNSGSMGSDIEVLKGAVQQFIDTKNKGEIIGIVTFDSYVLQNTGLTKDEEVLEAAIGNFAALGGTNIASGVNAAFGEYDMDENAYNVMIVMTDGQDSSFGQSQLNELRQLCAEKNVVLYTIGLGDVSAEYLENIARNGMGSFVYSSSSAQLEELYSFIHNQLDNNYLLTFTAKDVNTKTGRVLTVTNESEGFKASREYSIVDGEADEVPEEVFIDNPEEVCVSKLGVSTIIKSADKNPATVYEFTVLGTGFSKVSNASVSLQGKRDYTGLDAVITNDQTITVKLPDDVEYGSYDVLVNVDGTSYTLSALNVMKSGTKQEIRFGDYVFNAYSITEEAGLITLTGNVSMNDYLNFYGTITLSGDLEGNILVIGDQGGSYIDGTGILPGLLAQFFDNRIDIPKVDGLTLYKEADKYDKYHVLGQSYYGPIEIHSPYIELCPGYMNYAITDFSFDFPLLNNILDYAESPFKATGVENKLVLAKGDIGIVLNVKSDVNLDGELSFGKASLGLDSFSLGIDTINNNYSLGLAVGVGGVDILGKLDGDENEPTFGFDIAIKSGKFDSFDLGADFDIDAITVPPAVTLMTLSDFHIGVEGMANGDQDTSLPARILSSTFYGQADVNFFKLNQLIPGLDAILGKFLDITVLKLDDTKLGVRISNFNMSLDTTAVLLEQVELGKVAVDLGNYDYENFLLNINSQEVVGVHLEVSRNFGLDFGENFLVNTSGIAQVDVNNVFAGAMVNGNINYNIKFFRRFKDDIEGRFLIGVHNNATQFTVLVKGNDYMEGEEGGVRATFSKGNFLPEVTFY